MGGVFWVLRISGEDGCLSSSSCSSSCTSKGEDSPLTLSESSSCVAGLLVVVDFFAALEALGALGAFAVFVPFPPLEPLFPFGAAGNGSAIARN